jgi:hypothetical protein
MKTMVNNLILLALFSAAAGCGKQNESGKASNPVANPYYSGVPLPQIGGINSPYSFAGISLNQVQLENPCISDYPGFPGIGVNNFVGNRIMVQQPLTGYPTVIPPGDMFVGVTSYGDVAALVGQAAGQPPIFVAYLCPRSSAPNGQGQIVNITTGSYSQCLFKPMTAATMVFPGGSVANFRWLDAGTSVGVMQNTMRKFSFCR